MTSARARAKDVPFGFRTEATTSVRSRILRCCVGRCHSLADLSAVPFRAPYWAELGARLGDGNSAAAVVTGAKWELARDRALQQKRPLIIQLLHPHVDFRCSDPLFDDLRPALRAVLKLAQGDLSLQAAVVLSAPSVFLPGAMDRMHRRSLLSKVAEHNLSATSGGTGGHLKIVALPAGHLSTMCFDGSGVAADETSEIQPTLCSFYFSTPRASGCPCSATFPASSLRDSTALWVDVPPNLSEAFFGDHLREVASRRR